MTERKHRHYYKDVARYSEVDVYRVLRLFNVTDQALGHALKKLLVAGGRGSGTDITKDVQEAIDTLVRWQEMQAEDAPGDESKAGPALSICSEDTLAFVRARGFTAQAMDAAWPRRTVLHAGRRRDNTIEWFDLYVLRSDGAYRWDYVDSVWKPVLRATRIQAFVVSLDDKNGAPKFTLPPSAGDTMSLQLARMWSKQHTRLAFKDANDTVYTRDAKGVFAPARDDDTRVRVVYKV